jgi:hypothetical protein
VRSENEIFALKMKLLKHFWGDTKTYNCAKQTS